MPFCEDIDDVIPLVVFWRLLDQVRFEEGFHKIIGRSLSV